MNTHPTYATFVQDQHDAGIMYWLTRTAKESSEYAPTSGAKETMRRIKEYIRSERDQLNHIVY